MAPGKAESAGNDSDNCQDHGPASPFVGTAEALENQKISEVNLKTTWFNERQEPEFIRDVCPYFAPTLCNMGVFACIIFTGKPLLGAWCMFVGTPIYNMFLYHDDQNIARVNEKKWMKSGMFFIPLYAYIFWQTIVWIWTLILFSDVRPDHWLWNNAYPKNPWQFFAIAGITGFFNALSGIAGHELVHQKSPVHKFFGNWPYIKSMYTHFWDEHVNGHHKHIATEFDPVSHPIGSNLYIAVPKAIIMTHVTSYKREQERLTQLNGGHQISWFKNLTCNRMVYYFLFNLWLGYVIFYLLGTRAFLWQLLYSYNGAMYLESVNYLEHYGLRRRKDKNGIFESVGYQHSWSAVSSPISFRIQRHSDHHAHVFRPYQILRRFDRAPTMPFEYILMLFMIIFPPVYWMINDPRVKSIEDAKNGTHNEDAWNATMPLSAADKKRHRMAYAYFSFAFIIFTGIIWL